MSRWIYRGEFVSMVNTVMEKSFVIETFRSIFRRILCSSLGESAGEAVLFFLRRGLGRDPSDALWEDPKAVYYTMERTLGTGAKILIDILITRINQEYRLNMGSERFLSLMRNGNQDSVEEIRVFLKEIAESHRKRE